MAPAKQDTAVTPIGQEQFQEFIRAQMREAVRFALCTVLEEEVTVLVGANPYERTATRRDHRNGHYVRDLDTSVGHLESLAVPRTRRGHQTQVFERYQRRRAEVDQTIGEMFVRGVSTQGVGWCWNNSMALSPVLQRSHVSFIRSTQNMRLGRSVHWRNTMRIVLPMARTSA